jgi:hypothetical protein
MRVPKDKRARQRMCSRLTELIDVVYGESDAGIARLMGYSNPSTLHRMRRFEAFPDVERLERLVAAKPAAGIVINLNWIVAGVGQPLLQVSRGMISREMSIGEFVDWRTRRV